MADSMNVSNQGTGKIDLTKWKKLTAQEIISEEGKGEEVPAEILAWAQQMAAFSRIPDSVTYDRVDGDTGVDALEKLGLPTEEPAQIEEENAEEPVETEQPDAVKDPTKPAELQPEQPTADENIFAAENPTAAPPAPPENDTTDDAALTLADPKLSTDPEEIRKRRMRRGEV